MSPEYSNECQCQVVSVHDPSLSLPAEYAPFKDYRQQAVAETDSCFFTIRPLTAL